MVCFLVTYTTGNASKEHAAISRTPSTSQWGSGAEFLSNGVISSTKVSAAMHEIAA
jgi:hypothetical protein